MTKKPKPTTILDIAMPPCADGSPADWLNIAVAELRAQNATKIGGPIRLEIKAALPERPRDLDEIGKVTRNLLAAAGVIDDQYAVVTLSLRWDRTVSPGRCHLALWRSSAPAARTTRATRERISVAQRARWDAVRAAKGAPA
jgi:hypothetical protein